ncbi:MAG: tRNA epoxyqueuosine(34) reductase QueG [Aestuariivirga sp.]|nr:tRNA epoxyqueuosine(34) reductase QueG [Aestuariivirga sp.]
MSALARAIRERARREGFDAMRITRPEADAVTAERLGQFLAEGRHGGMAWMVETGERRQSPLAMWPAAKSAIMLAQNYAQDLEPLERLKDRESGVISVYALNRDYHDVVKGKLKRIAQWLAHETGAEVKVFGDTAPLMEKPLAQKAGLGWQGRHTNLVSRELGSWFFIGSILTTAELDPDAPEQDHCGSCRACLDICPTDAFPAPYQLDARRCISYLTIEHEGHIAPEFRAAMGNRIYGCDDCLAVCPWNKFAATAHEAKLMARKDLVAPRLADLLDLDDAGFRALFRGSPVKRTGRDRFIRNVLIAAGNSGDAALAPKAEALLADHSALVRAMAVWALSRLLPDEGFRQLRQHHLNGETDADVRHEWETA